MQNISEKMYRRELILQQKQAYEGAKMFYYGVLPLSIITLSVFLGFLYEEGKQTVRQNILTPIMWISLTITSYIIAVYFYIKCNSIQTFPTPQSHSIQSHLTITHQQTLQPSTLQLTHRSIQPSNDDNQKLYKSQKITKPMLHYCHKCQRNSQYRTKHCRKCQTCIQRFDHHCFWIGNCVGRHNHKLFYLFLLCQSLNNFSQMKAIISIRHIFSLSDLDFHWTIWAILYLMLLTSLGFLCFTGYLAVYHTILIILGMTTWQHMRRQKISYLKYLPKGYNPFSIGWKNNIKKFFSQQTRANNANCCLQEWQHFLPTFEQSKSIKPGFNFIENQYYSCC